MDSDFRLLLPTYLIVLLWGISWGVSVNGPVMPLYVKSLGIEVMGWSMLVMSWAAGMVLSEWIWGTMSDRVNRRIFILISMLCMSIIFSLYTFEGLIPYFLILQFLFGVFGIIPAPITRALLQDDSPVKSIGLSMSLWWVFITLGQMVGSLVGSYIAQVSSFRHSFYLSSLLSLIGALAVSITLRRNNRQKPLMERKSSQGTVKGLGTLIAIPSLWILFLLAFFAFMVISALRSFLPLYASEYVGLSTLEVGMVDAAFFMTQLMVAPLFGWLSDRVGRKHLMVSSLTLSSLMLLCYLFAKTSSQLLLVSIGASMSFSMSSLLLALLSEITPSGLRGAALGMYGSFEDLGLFIGPILYGLIWTMYTPAFVFVVSSGTQILSIPLVFLIGRKPRTD